MDLADEWSAESNDSFLQFGKANKTFLGFSVKALVINFVAKKKQYQDTVDTQCYICKKEWREGEMRGNMQQYQKWKKKE